MQRLDDLCLVLPIKDDEVNFALYPLTRERARKWYDRLAFVRARTDIDEEFHGITWKDTLELFQYDYEESLTIVNKPEHPDQAWAQTIVMANDIEVGVLSHASIAKPNHSIGKTTCLVNVCAYGIAFDGRWKGQDLDIGWVNGTVLLYARLYFARPSERECLLKELAHESPVDVIELFEKGFQIPGIPKHRTKIDALPESVLAILLGNKDAAIRERVILLTDRIKASRQRREGRPKKQKTR